MAWETLLFEIKDAVGIVTLNRPKQMNALNGQLLQDLGDVLAQCESDWSVGALILTGGTRFFCTGADVTYVNTLSATEFAAFSRKTRMIFHNLETFRKPAIAAINGHALGGGLELALCCDLRVAAENAKLGLPEAKLGGIPGAGGTQRLPRLIGPARAKEIIYTGDFITAGEAWRIGLVNATATAGECLDRAAELAARIAERAPLALAAAKKSINTGLGVDLESGLDFEAQCASSLEGTADHEEGFRSFQEKRKPVWRGR